MRIALLAPANSVHTQRWFAAIRERGHEVLLISQHAPSEGFVPPEGTLRMLPIGGTAGYFLNALWLRHVLAYYRPDVLNVHYASGYGLTAALVGYRPTLLSVWGSDVFDFPYESAPKGWLIRWNLRRATSIASTSHVMARQVRRLLPTLESDIAITPFGVDLARFHPAQRALGGEAAAVTIGSTKSLEHKYGLDTLIEAFALLLADPLLRERAAAGLLRLQLVGTGSRRAALEELCRARQVVAHVEFLGPLPHGQIPEFLRTLDVYVAPSRLDSESFGVAVVEASASGLPVVVANVGGLAEVVVDGSTGFVVAKDRPDLLAERLRLLVADPGLRATLGAAGRELVAARYDWTLCVDQMLAAYGRLARPAPPVAVPGGARRR